MKKILVATDFSENAQTALAYAIVLGKVYQSEIFVLHTYLPLYTEHAVYTSAANLQKSMDKQHLTLEADMAPLVEQVLAADLACTPLLELNDVASGVFEAVEKYHIDLVVMGRTGSGGFMDKLIGSNAAHITAKANIPVLTVPSQLQAQEASLTHILYATQLEFDEIPVLQQVFTFVKALSAKVTLLKVNAPFEPDIHSDNQYIKEIHSNFAQEDFTLEQVASSSVTEGILSTAQKLNANLIVLAAHHRNFLTQLIDPSKSKQVIVSANIPVLTFQL